MPAGAEDKNSAPVRGRSFVIGKIMAKNIYVKRANAKNIGTSIQSTYLTPLEIEETQEPWEVRVFNSIDKILLKATPVFLMLAVTYLATHLVLAIFR